MEIKKWLTNDTDVKIDNHNVESITNYHNWDKQFFRTNKTL